MSPSKKRAVWDEFEEGTPSPAKNTRSKVQPAYEVPLSQQQGVYHKCVYLCSMLQNNPRIPRIRAFLGIDTINIIVTSWMAYMKNKSY